ncbi:hypothetical protein M9H77_29098 [Catharanthus roseus]|uniref:Uncharacterized protein n=1 Tax=Catharanthus roseus TaxID=4058 RepID=A0ACC0AJ60_CATRO|nr:hypothetical protein M9H77_29098 [Catharanthus roseus]
MQVKKLESMTSRTGREFQRYNFQGCRQVVGCIPWRFRRNNKSGSVHGPIMDEIEFLLISSQKSPKWMFPKGGWELDESMEEAAIRETMEEAGVLGEVGVQLGMWRFQSKSQDCSHEGYMFAFEVKEELDVWPEKDVRKRLWLPASEAREKCVHQWMKYALDVFLCQLSELQSMEEEQQAPTTTTATALFDFFVAEESTRTTTIVAQSGKEEGINCHHLLPLTHHLQIKEEKFRMPCLIDLFTAEESMIGIVTQSGLEEDINCHLLPIAHLQIKEEDCRMNCSLEFLRTEEPRIGKVTQNGEDDVGGCLVS